MKNKKLQQQHASAIRILVAIGDFFLLNLAFFAVIYIFRTHYFGLLNYAELKYRIVLVNMSYAISLFSTGIILDRRIVYSENIVALVFRTTIIFAGILFAASSILNNSFIFTNWYWILYVVAVFICISSWRILSRSILKSYRFHGGNHRQLIILGAGSVAQKVYNATVTNLEYGYRFIGFFEHVFFQRCVGLLPVPLAAVRASQYFYCINKFFQVFMHNPVSSIKIIV